MSVRDGSRLSSDTAERAADENASAPAPKPGHRVPAPIAFARNVWRQLTSMRTALILLFLLALASVPGALLPQWSLNEAKTAQYILDNGEWAVWLSRLGFFEVFASPWYSAIYLLLMISLVGCLTPRTIEFAGHLRRPPVRTPRNLARLPLHDEVVNRTDPQAAADAVVAGLRGWRVARAQESAGTVTVSAEKGYLREVGNLIFHLALLGMLVSIAVGKLVGFEGSVIVNAAGTGMSVTAEAQRVGDASSEFCSASTIAYDSFRPGLLIDGTELPPFCVSVDSFTAEYTDIGMAREFSADVRYQLDPVGSPDAWESAVVQVNDPLRFPGGQRLYLLGHGYSPIFTVTWPDGSTQTQMAPFEPQDSMFTSQGAVKFPDPPPGVLEEGEQVTDRQLAVVGIFAPSAFVHQEIMTSTFPAAEQPAVAIRVFQGDLGMEGGRAQSVFAIDEGQVDSGLLWRVASENLAPGESLTLDDGTVIEFTGFREFVALQTSYDPAQGWALVSAIVLLAGLMLSLAIKRRRVWYRISAREDGPGSTVQVGGLARTDQAGYGEEFTRLVALART